MTHYQELTIMSQVEVPLHFIWSKLYTQLHLAFAESQDTQAKIAVGVSFPEYRYEAEKAGCLGSKLRVFAQSEAVLQQFDLSKWLSRLTDYVHCTGIREVPANRVTGYAQYRRQRVKGSPEKLAKRHAKRHDVSFEEAMQRYQKMKRMSKLPYIQLKSLTNQQSFRLFIEKKEVVEAIHDGFGTYGLGVLSTVPEF